MTHTPTPWIVEQYSVSGITKSYHVKMSNGYTISTSALDPDKIKNTHLISAAPDMLEALEGIILIIEKHSRSGISEKTAEGGFLKKAYDAIAKAKGESQ